MFHSISWQQYFIFILTCSIIYYLIILLFFYGNELLKITTHKKLSFKGVPKPDLTTLDNNMQVAIKKNNPAVSVSQSEQEMLFPLVHELLQELNGILNDAALQGYSKEELKFAIIKSLNGYKQIDKSVFQISVNNHIAEECKNKCSIHFSKDEVKGMWL